MVTPGENPTIVVLDPTSPPRQLLNPMASRPLDIRGMTVGFLWNNKPNGDLLFHRLEELLRQKYEVKAAIYRKKLTASVPAGDHVLDELVASADAVVVGLAD